MSGTTLEISSSDEISAAPGRVDIPPISRRSAPCWMWEREEDEAEETESLSPPSENESGVVLMIDIMRVRLSADEQGEDAVRE